MAQLWHYGAALALLVAVAFGGGKLAAEETAPPEAVTPEAVERLAAQISACAMVSDPTERLQCYDEAAGREGDTVVPEGVILELAGSDDFDSDRFRADGPWHLRWDSSGSIFTVELNNVAGELIGIIGNQIGAGSNRSEALPPGDYMLAVRAIGEWQLWVMEED